MLTREAGKLDSNRLGKQACAGRLGWRPLYNQSLNLKTANAYLVKSFQGSGEWVFRQWCEGRSLFKMKFAAGGTCSCSGS
eukprot:668264-Pelagomonas_calceolata.AAC.2